MNTLLRPASETLDGGICGFHQYLLGERPVLGFVSQSLLKLLQIPELSGSGDPYRAFVHPADREAYDGFLKMLSDSPRQERLCYRLVRSDGNILSVCDQMTSFRCADGSLGAESVLTAVRSSPQEQVPWGFLRCSCEKQPRITDMNRPMREILRLNGTGEEELELYRENIFLMLPMEERRRFARYLDRICAEDIPVFGETTLLRSDGTRAHVFGWVTRGESASGEEEFQAVCLDVSEYQESRREQAARRYLSALKDVYDKIFQYDLGDGILKCLYDSRESRFRWLQNIPMQLEEATEQWVTQTVVPEEQKKVLAFFRSYCHVPNPGADTRPPRITYHARSSSGEIRTYGGIFLKMDDTVSLYCCRCLPDPGAEEQLRTENSSLKENMQELLVYFTDGIAAFQLENGMVTPLYITDNICEFFGRTREEWLPMMKKATPIRDFVSQSAVDYEKFDALLHDGEAEFSYLDLDTHTRRRMKAICSHKSDQPGIPRYVMLYNVEDSREESKPHVYIRTFGYFDVFVDETPIAFRNRKSKELFALLVDRQGGFVSSEEAIGYLWEDEPVSPVTLARYRKVALRLKNLLAEYGISDVVEAVDGKRRLVPQKVRCDLLDYLSGREDSAQLFKGSYLTNYSWGETTLAELSGAARME